MLVGLPGEIRRLTQKHPLFFWDGGPVIQRLTQLIRLIQLFAEHLFIVAFLEQTAIKNLGAINMIVEGRV